MENYFTFKDQDYVRHLDPLKDYIDMQSFYLHRVGNKPLDVARKYVVDNIKPDGKFPLKNAQVAFLSREEQRDRVRATTTILDYIATARKRNYIFVPAWNCYFPSYVKESLYTGYIEATSGNRSRYKKAMFIAEQKGDEPAIKFNDGMQSSAKISINSISGAALASHTINHTQSLHPTLTSVCASITAMANLNNEKLIAGNRIYLSYQATLDNLISIVIRADLEQLNVAMEEFNLHHPTTDDVMECVLKSARNYWRDQASVDKIRRYVDTLNYIEKAAILYIGDLYHTYKHNPHVVREFLNGFTHRVHDVLDIETATQVEKNADDDVAILAKLLCKEYLMGTTMFDLKADSPAMYGEVCANMLYIEHHLEQYKNFIKGILRPSFLNPGGNRYFVFNMLREAVLTSDTDSTIYTAQYWVKEMTGSIGFDDDHYGVGFAISFLVNKTVYHQLAMMSKNMGFEDKNLHIISMKNEYYFPVYGLTNQTKNYFAYISVREGNVYKKMKLEKKGVGLRSSKIPKNIMNSFDKHIRYLMDKIISTQNITIDELFKTPYETETMVRNSIMDGKGEYFQTQQVKSADAYKKGDDAPPLKLHRLWEEVFAAKYGEAPELPYMALKISTKLTSARKLDEWINSFDDVHMANALRSYLKNEMRKDLGTIYVPQLTIGKGAIPPEIVAIIDVNKQLMNVMSQFYLVLESFGFYLKNPNNTTMIHTHYKPQSDEESS